MSEPIRAVRGMNDILPEEAERWETLEELLRDWLRSYGYRNVRTPILEHTAHYRLRNAISHDRARIRDFDHAAGK